MDGAAQRRLNAAQRPHTLNGSSFNRLQPTQNRAARAQRSSAPLNAGQRGAQRDFFRRLGNHGDEEVEEEVEEEEEGGSKRGEKGKEEEKYNSASFRSGAGLHVLLRFLAFALM